jgi:hypothetical protein
LAKFVPIIAFREFDTPGISSRFDTEKTSRVHHSFALVGGCRAGSLGEWQYHQSPAWIAPKDAFELSASPLFTDRLRLNIWNHG